MDIEIENQRLIRCQDRPRDQACNTTQMRINERLLESLREYRSYWGSPTLMDAITAYMKVKPRVRTVMP